MRAPILIGALLTAAIGTLLSAQAPAPSAPPVTFNKDIQPLLESTCWSCHVDAVQLSTLDLRPRDSALKGGSHGPAIVPGNAEQSQLYRRVAGLETPAMPMQAPPLTAEQVAAVKTWIDQGAMWDASDVAGPGTRPTLAERRAGGEGGQVIGSSDDFGYKAAEQPVSYHDLHATMLHLLGLDHTKLTYRANGRDMRLTDVYGTLIPQIVG